MDVPAKPPTGRRSARATISDVAERAGVDRAVVSKVLSEDPSLRVRAETRERVRRAASDLGYRPNFHARSLARSRASALGLLMPEGNPLFTEVMAGAEEVATERDLLLWTATHGGHLSERHRRLLQGGVVDALLVTGLDADVDAHKLFAETQVPVLLVNRRSKGSDRWVILDDTRAAEVATRHLLGLGHTRIAFLGGPAGVDTAERRLAGFRTAMRSAGVRIDPSLVVRAAYTSAAGGAAVDVLLQGSRRPTAIVAADAPLGLGAWHALETQGIRVPDGMSVIAIHRPPAEEYRVPSLTCVQLPLRALGRRAAELVLDTPPGDPIEAVVRAEVSVSVGGTVGPPLRRARWTAGRDRSSG